MKTRTLLLIVALAAVWQVRAGTATYSLRGVEYTVDTLFHAYVGPGTTQTSLLLQSGTKHLRVFYSQIDLSQPNVTLKAVSGTDRMTGSETVSGMANRKTAPGNRYYLGVNGDFWMTSGYTGRGVSMIGTPISSSMAEGILYRGRNNDGEYQFTIDSDEVPHLGNVNFGGTVVKTDGTSASIFGVNVDAGNNQITLYNPIYYSGTNQGGDCAEVQVRYVDGDSAFAFGQPCQLLVVGSPSGAGDMDVPGEGLVLHGRGTTRDFIGTLSEGDTLTLTLNAVLNGRNIDPREIISGQPWIVFNGETTPNGNPDVHPRTALGYSEDGKTVIFMVVDGRSTLSDGVTTDALGDLMRYAGAYMALNVDGGGSSCMYTSALGVRNRPSDGTERADSNGIFAVCSSPDDDEVTSVRFLDWALTMPKYGTYVPKFFGYNQYGMLVDTDLKGVVLLCPESIGEVKGDTLLYATGSGTAMLTAVYGNDTISIPITVIESSDGIKLLNDSIINDTYRDYAVELVGTVLDKEMPINPMALTWASSDESVVAINAETGVLRGVTNGKAYVVGTIGEVADTMWVTVEKPLSHAMAVDPVMDMDTWNITHSGGKNGVTEADGKGGFYYRYTGASSRAPKLTLSKQFRLWSLPDTLRLRVNPGEAPLKSVIFSVRACGKNINYQTITPESIEAGKDLVIDLPTASWIDADDMGNYPLTLNSLQIMMNAAEVGKQYEMHFQGLETIYNAVPADAVVAGDVDGNGTVNVSDVTALVNMILGVVPKDDVRADVDGNGTVNVSDVTALVNLILGVG